ncbi:MAG: glycosyltransferase family 4 protein [Actinomycetes bacterium]
MVSFAEVLGGAERSLLELARRLPPRGWTPVLACPPGRLADVAAADGIRVEVLPLRPVRAVSRVSRRRPGKSYSAAAVAARAVTTARNAWQLARLARELDAALIHSNSLPSHLSAALAGAATGRPVLWHLREIIRPGAGRTFFSRAGRLVSGMVAISDSVATTVSHRSVTTVYNPVDAPPTDVPPLDLPLPRPLVGYLGRLDAHKGIEDLIPAVGTTSAHLVVAGRRYAAGEEYVESLRELARREAPGRVHFVGEVAAPWELLAGVDVLVVPSLAEPWGRVAAEGQRAGVAVLAADAGGLPEIVTDGRDGLLFPPSDAEALGRQLRRLLEDEPLRSRLASTGRTTSTRFDPERHADAMARLLEAHATPDVRQVRARGLAHRVVRRASYLPRRSVRLPSDEPSNSTCRAGS